MKEIKTFADVRRYLASIPNIDEGGCGIAALVMHRWLKRQGKASEIVYFYSSTTSMSYVSNEAIISGRELDYDPMSCAHALIKYRGKFYDPNGIQNDSRPFHILDEDFVVRSIRNEFAWSCAFNRCYVPEIALVTGIDLKDIILKP